MNRLACAMEKPAETKNPNDSSRPLAVSQTASSSGTSVYTESIPSTPMLENELKVSSKLKKFTFSELKSATRNFRPESVLGGGGFGYVFKGWIEENGTAPVKPGTGLTVAVKTLNPDGLQGHKEWLVRNVAYFCLFIVYLCFLAEFLRNLKL